MTKSKKNIELKKPERIIEKDIQREKLTEQKSVEQIVSVKLKEKYCNDSFLPCKLASGANAAINLDWKIYKAIKQGAEYKVFMNDKSFVWLGCEYFEETPEDKMIGNFIEG